MNITCHGTVSGSSKSGCGCSLCCRARLNVKTNKDLRAKRMSVIYGTEPPKHGTNLSYTEYGCRCEICVAFKKAGRLACKGRLWGKEPPEHGVTGYVSYGCRCGICKAARSKNAKEFSDKPENKIREKERCWNRQGIKQFTHAEFSKKYLEQGGRCLICGRAISMSSKNKSELATVDHDHQTGMVRGLLCVSCNMMIGIGDAGLLLTGANYLDAQKESGV